MSRLRSVDSLAAERRAADERGAFPWPPSPGEGEPVPPRRRRSGCARLFSGHAAGARHAGAHRMHSDWHWPLWWRCHLRHAGQLGRGTEQRPCPESAVGGDPVACDRVFRLRLGWGHRLSGRPGPPGTAAGGGPADHRGRRCDLSPVRAARSCLGAAAGRPAIDALAGVDTRYPVT